jgi:cytochrome c-type biogenesis protein CcsB
MGMFGYVVAFALFLSVTLFKKDGWSNYAWIVVIFSVLLHTIAVATRWITTAHPPVSGEYENALLAAWSLAIFYTIVAWRRATLRPLAIVVAPALLIILGLGFMSNVSPGPLAPPYKSNWLWIHVAFAWLAFSGFAMATGLAVAYLLKDSGKSEVRFFSILNRLPENSIIDDLILRYVAFGFISEALMIVSGGIWATDLWGRFWSWDPVETWSLICWLGYGLFLHLRITRGWRGRKAAWLAIGLLITNIISLWGVRFLPSTHIPIL